MERALCWTYYTYTERKTTKILSSGTFTFHRREINNLELVFGG